MRFWALAGTWAVLWSGAFIATKTALDDGGPLTTVAIRCLGAGALLLALQPKRTWEMARRGMSGMLVVGALNNAGYLGLMAMALPNLPAAMAAIVTSLTPVTVLVLSSLRGAALRRAQWVGCLLGVAGVAGSGMVRLGDDGTSVAGIGQGIAAVACLVAGTVLTPRLVPAGSPVAATGVQSLAGGVLCLAGAIVLEGAPAATGQFVASQVYLVVGASMAGMTLWLMIIREFGAERAAVAHFLPPMVSMVLAMVILGEPVRLAAVVMCVPVAAGVYLATSGRRATASGAAGAPHPASGR